MKEITVKPSEVNCLAPARLLIVKVRMNNLDLNALIDSGATTSLIRSKFISDSIKPGSHQNQSVFGLGGTKVEVKGEVSETISIFNEDFKAKFLVVDPNDIDYDIIIGVDFLKRHKFKINLAQRKIIVTRHDDAIMNVYLDEFNKITKIMMEKVPVYCSEKTNLKPNEIVKVPIEFQCHNDYNPSENENMVFFEAETTVARSIDGIMPEKGKNCVLVEKVKRGTIEKGQILGHVYSMYTIENENQESEDGEWSKNKIERDIELGDHLTAEEKDKVRGMLLKMKYALSKGDDDIGNADVEPHKIELTQHTPIWQKARSFSQPINDEIERQCDDLLSNDILEYSNSQWSAPVVPVRKSDGGLRLCVDYRQVNKVTKKENYPMPNLMNCVYRPNKVNYFTKIDLVRGYYQVPIDEESRKYTAFSTIQHHYQFKRLSFGLKNSGMAFQRIMQQILAPLITSNIIIYIDDILILSESFEEHMKLVGKVLSLLMDHGIKVKVSKCEWFKEEVVFLGHVINKEGIRKSPEYVDKIKNVTKPGTVKEMRKFLGLINFQRKFVKDCSLLTKSLTQWTVGSRNKKIEWNEEMTQAFESLKDEVMKDVMLVYPDYSSGASKLELYVDASNSGSGACLMQKSKGEYKVVAYGSMMFSDTEKRYNTTERELAALRWGISNFRCFLAGVPFVLITDHKPLIYLNNMSPNSSRLMRTLTELAEFEFEVRYRPGAQNEAADYLSRLNDEQNIIDEEVLDHKYLPKELKRICEIQGGGDSMFESLVVAMKEGKENEGYKGDFPDNHSELRVLLVDELIKNGKEYNLNNGKQLRQRLKLMKKIGQHPISEVLLAASKLCGVRILVYCGMKSPIVFTYDESIDFVIRLQCISLTHYNPLYERKKIEDFIQEKHVNITSVEKEGECCSVIDDDDLGDLELGDTISRNCNHSVFHTTVKVPTIDQNNYCCLLDTGAQVSLVRREVIEELQKSGSKIDIRKNGNTLIGLGKAKENVVEFVDLEVEISGCSSKSVPFAITSNMAIPCCFLLGANYIKLNGIEMDFQNDQLTFTKVHPNEKYLINNAIFDNSDVYRFGAINYMSLTVESNHGSEELNHTESDSGSDDEDQEPKYLIERKDLLAMQKRNYALRKLKSMIQNNLPINQWNDKSTHQFKRSAKKLKMSNGLMVYKQHPYSPVVVSFPFMIEIVAKTHKSLNHIGRHKLLKAIQPHFWHPGLDKICLDFCRSCAYCQLYKSHKIDKPPPVTKIQTNYPFELVSVDLLMLEKTRKGNTYLLVCVDHYSKWLAVSPMKDKRSITVANALQNHILPSMPKIPDRLLSDNGMEFLGSEFKSMLAKFNINHCNSTPYHAAGNGGCERVNKTIIQMLKDYDDEHDDWDQRIFNVVINYNNNVHSETNMSPAQHILTIPHSSMPRFPLSEEMTRNWKEGHPNFCPYMINQKVLRKIHTIGTQLKDKLRKKFDGPYTIVKIQTNKISYEIKDEDTGKVIKVNHRQLRPWHEIPKYIGKYLLSHEEITESGEYKNQCSSKVNGNTSISSDSSSMGSDSNSESMEISSESSIETSENESSSSASTSSEEYQSEVSIKSTATGCSKVSINEDRRLRRNDEVSIKDQRDSDKVSPTEESAAQQRLTSPNESIISSLDVSGSGPVVQFKDIGTQTSVFRKTHLLSTDSNETTCIADEELIDCVKDANESKRKVKVLEQHLSLCDELLEECLSKTSNYVELAKDDDEDTFHLNEAIFTKSITGLEVIHSTPTSNAINEYEMEKLSLSDVRPTQVSNPRETSEDNFSGFTTIKHIIGLLDNIQKICGENKTNKRKPSESPDEFSLSDEMPSTEKGKDNNNEVFNIVPLISEASDTISDLPKLSPIRVLRSRVIMSSRDRVAPYKKRRTDK